MPRVRGCGCLPRWERQAACRGTAVSGSMAVSPDGKGRLRAGAQLSPGPRLSPQMGKAGCVQGRSCLRVQKKGPQQAVPFRGSHGLGATLPRKAQPRLPFQDPVPVAVSGSGLRGNGWSGQPHSGLRSAWSATCALWCWVFLVLWSCSAPWKVLMELLVSQGDLGVLGELQPLQPPPRDLGQEWGHLDSPGGNVSEPHAGWMATKRG